MLSEIAANGTQIVAESPGVLVTNPPNIFDNRIFPHRSILDQFFRCTDHGDDVVFRLKETSQFQSYHGVRNMLAIPGQEIIHSVNRRQGDMQGILGRFLRNDPTLA